MAVTLAQAKLNVQDALQKATIDEFAKSNFLLGMLDFDDCVSPTGGGTTMTYSYNRIKTQPTAQFRAINTEYTTQEVEKEQIHANLKIFGGAFNVDRVIAGMGGIANEVTIQMQQKIKAASALFNDNVINGDSAVDEIVFDGLEKAVTGSSTEFKPSKAIDLSSSDLIDTNWKYFMDALDEFLLCLDGQPGALLCNNVMLARMRAVARRAGMYQVSKNDWGQQVETYGNIPLVDLGSKAGSNELVSKIYTDTIGGNSAPGLTQIYAVRFGLDGFHAISPVGGSPVKTWLPDFKTAGAVKKGEVEMIAAIALKATKSAGVMRGIKVQ